MSNVVTFLTEPASAEGTYAIKNIQFLDEDDTAIVPNADTVTWCLTDDDGNVINNLEDQDLDSELTMKIVLSGADLAVSGDPDNIGSTNNFRIDIYRRRLSIRGEVNSTLGDDLPVTHEFVFNIEKITCL